MLWSTIRALSIHPAVRATIFVPLLGYMILFNAKVSEALKLAHEIAGVEPVDALSWRLIIIYFGLIALSLDAIGYAIFCHPAVKYYGSADAYVNTWQSIMKDYAMAAIEDELKDSKFAVEYDAIRKSDETVMYEKPLVERKSELYNAYLHLHFKYLNQRLPAARFAISAFLLIGFGLLAIPSLNVFWSVSAIMFRKL